LIVSPLGKNFMRRQKWYGPTYLTLPALPNHLMIANAVQQSAQPDDRWRADTTADLAPADC
jgi:hypothetical protein